MLRAWLQLLRISLAPTIAWDVVAGALLAGHPPGVAWLVPLAAGLLLYHAGMVLNDVVDLARDLEDRPERPLPSGLVGPGTALAVGLAMVLLALGLVLFLARDILGVAVLLAAVVLVYDLGGPTVRRLLGPGLLAAARAGALLLGVLGPGSPGAARTPLLLAACGAQALYYLFVSRLASHEERGCPGMRALPFLALASVAPLLLFRSGLSATAVLFLAAWLPLPLWLLVPAWPLRHENWGPAQVQAAVRRSLVAAPWVPSLALLAAGLPLGLCGGVAVILLVRLLAPAFRPE